MHRFYTGIIEKAKDGFGVFFPDLPGCTSFGKTIEQAAIHAFSAAQAHVALSREYGDFVAEPRATDEIPVEKGVKEKARLLIPVELSDEPVRVNIPGAALEALDRTAKELSLSRSGRLRIWRCRGMSSNRKYKRSCELRNPRNACKHKTNYGFGCLRISRRASAIFSRVPYSAASFGK